MPDPGVTLPCCLCPVMIPEARQEGPPEVAQYMVQSTRHAVPLTHHQEPTEGRQASRSSRATRRGGIQHQSACASWPGEGFARGAMMMMSEGQPRSSLDGSCPRASWTAEVTFSTCPPELQPPSRLLCPEGSQERVLPRLPRCSPPHEPASAVSSVRGASASRIRARVRTRTRRTPKKPQNDQHLGVRRQKEELSTDPTRARQRYLGSYQPG